MGKKTPVAEWVEEQTLGIKGSRFTWMPDEQGGVAIRVGTATVEARRFPREDLERLQGLMADHAWHPATQHTETALGPQAERSIEGFGRAELGWGTVCARMAAHLCALFAHAGLWDWNEQRRGMKFRLAERDLAGLRVYYDRRRQGAARPNLERRCHVPKKRPSGPAFDLSVTFRSLSVSLRARFEACLGGRHPAEKGQRREMALIELLRAHLPMRYGVTRGEVIASTAECSGQADVLIYDALRSPALLATESSALLAVESLYATIEVKPKLRVADLKKAAANLRSIKAFPRTALLRSYVNGKLCFQPSSNPPIFGAIFAQESDPPGRLLHALNDIQSGLDPSLWVDCICILDEAVIYRVGGPSGPASWSSAFSAQRTPVRLIRMGPDSLLFFYLMLLQDINTKTLVPPDLLFYWPPGEMPPSP